MNCPKCGTPAQAGATHCKRCGTALAAKAKAAKAAAEPASDDIDLMPMEESKTPAFSAYEPPPGLDIGPPPAPVGKAPAGPPDPNGPPPDMPGKKVRGDDRKRLLSARALADLDAWLGAKAAAE